MASISFAMLLHLWADHEEIMADRFAWPIRRHQAACCFARESHPRVKWREAKTIPTASAVSAKCSVPLHVLHGLRSAVEDKPTNIKDRNFPGVLQLCDEFNFVALTATLSAHPWASTFSDGQTAQGQNGISSLEEHSVHQEWWIEAGSLHRWLHSVGLIVPRRPSRAPRQN
jgi:hypothetical protein